MSEPGKTYEDNMKQFEEWLAVNGYPKEEESPCRDLTFRYRSGRLLQLMKYIKYLYDENEKTLPPK